MPLARVMRRMTQLFFDGKQSIVFYHPFTAAGSAGFNESGVYCNGQVSYKRVFRFTGRWLITVVQTASLAIKIASSVSVSVPT